MKQSEVIFIDLLKSNKIRVDERGIFIEFVKHSYGWRAKKLGHKTPQGYIQLRKMVNRKRYHVGAHRIVYTWFNGPIPDGIIINHKNGLKDDNRLKNLELTTYSENQKHAHKNGLKDQRGEKNPAAKLKSYEVSQIRLAYSQGGFTQKELSKRYNVAHQTISDIVRGDTRKSDLGKTADYTHRRINNNQQRNKKGQFI